MVIGFVRLRRSSRGVACIMVLLCMVLQVSLVSAAPSTFSWTVSTVRELDNDEFHFYGFGDKMCVDSKGVTHVVFSDYVDSNFTIIYGTNPGGVWNFSTIAQGYSMGDFSIGIDAGDQVHVCYLDGGPEQIVYAKLDGGEWVKTVVFQPSWDFGYIYAYSPRMAVDRDGGVYIAARLTDANGTLQLITNTNGSWVSKNVPQSMNVSYPSIAVDMEGHVHVCYVDGNDEPYLVHATDKNGSWTVDRRNVTWSPGWYLGTAVDSKGVLHVLASSRNNTQGTYYMNQGTAVRHLKIDGSVWTDEVVTYTSTGYRSYFVSAAIDSHDGLHVCFDDERNNDLMYAHGSGGEWTVARVDSVDHVGYYCEVAVGSDDLPRICYYNDTGRTFKYAVASEASAGTLADTFTPWTLALITVVAAAVAIVLMVLFLKPRAK